MDEEAVARIRQLLSRNPGLKAQRIAGELTLERSRVVTILHGLSDVEQDSAYCWRLKTPAAAAPAEIPAQRTFLSRLCRYYLECLSRESGSGFSFPAADCAEYVPL